MEFYHYSPSETFVVLTADQFVGRGDGRGLNNRGRITTKTTKSRKLRIRNGIIAT